jgi:hypothetical protein
LPDVHSSIGRLAGQAAAKALCYCSANLSPIK